MGEASPTATGPRGLAALFRWLRPRPAEWVILVFAIPLACLVARGRGPSTVEAIPRLDVIFAALGVFALKLGRDYWCLPWKRPGSRLARLFPPTAILASVPVAVGIYAALAPLLGQGPLDLGDGGVGGAVLNAVRRALVQILAGLVPLLVWFALGIHAKREGRLGLGSFLGEGGLRALDQLRDFGAPLLIIVSYSYLGPALQVPLFADKDDLMRALDRSLFLGVEPVHALEAIISAPLSEWMAFCYTAYAVLMPVAFAAILVSSTRPALAELAFALTLCFALGFLGYALVPVRGPMFSDTFTVSLDYYYFGTIKDELLDRYRIARDCFPSLHTAIALVVLIQARRHVRKVFWALLPVVATIPVACVYLRYHWVSDVLAGAALAAAVSWASARLFSRMSGRGEAAGSASKGVDLTPLA